MLHWLREAIRVLPSGYSRLLLFCALTGLRGSEAIESVRLLNKREIIYYNPEQQILEHFRFPDLFIRRTKAVYISVVNDEIIGMARGIEKTPGLGETFGSIANTTGGGGGNETEQGILGLGLMSGGALNMTEAEMQEIRNVTEGLNWQKIMNSQFCSLVTDEKMIEEMLFSNRTIND